MTPTKLSDSEKLEIIELYKTTEENTITLADRYGVSSSTIRRILQSSIPEDEYKELVQQKQKRPSRSPKHIDQDTDDLDESLGGENLETEESDDREDEADGMVKRRRRRSSSSSDAETEQLTELPKLSLTSQYTQKSNDTFEGNYPPTEEIEEILAADLREQPQNLEDFENNDLEDFDEEFDDEDKFEEEEEGIDTSYNISIHSSSYSEVKVYDLTEAVLPKTCYIVVDKFTELVTKPLITFGELGQIPVEESQEKTLPVFDNHRVAHRFSARNQRVLKVPDGRMLQKTTVYLQAKGITRLLIDGQVYKL
ncbi:MAG: transcriptional regulator [Okeania sp. SIO3I5]|uniref:transcriptional regulator n=1 Tax=Okeania sp. SIO3I5 TaxID=2607805 RepID=UPI0013B76FDC|nr:transcriptional regulator [Okeania sp. SIO3I5]NEQ36018.1 transcriptional regulator [Okeania sp. SIO3I5]